MSLGDDDARDGATVDGAKPRGGPDFAVVGLAAAAGGVEALTSFFENMPDANGMAFIVVLRLTDDQESGLDDVLRRVTAMPVVRVQESTRIEPDHVYVVSPALNVSMNDGHLDVDRASRLQGRPAAIDVFLRKHAEVHRTRAVSVILSGAGTDGAVGIARVKECGGVTFAQRLDEAAESAMPRAAIETGTVDFVMPVADMPRKMVEVAENSKRIRLPPDPDVDPVVDRVEDPGEIALADEALRDILVTVRARTHHDFAHFRRGALLRRIERRMQVHAIPDLPCYRDYLREHVPESGALTQDLLISVTNFFRDRLAYLALERALRSLMEDRSARDPVRIWVAGCATGEEAYAIAMIALEVAESFPTRPDVQVFATDIDERAIATGRAGLYPSSIAADVSRERLRRFFKKEGDRYRVAPVVSDSVLFAVHNVLRDPPFARLDLICCRNLLVYLDRDVQAHLMRTFRFALKPGGILFLGTSEFAESVSDAFVPVDARERIYRASAEAPSRASRFDAPSPHPTEPREPAGGSHAQRHQHALDRLGPPSVLVDASHDILHVSENAGRFLHHDGRRPSQHLVSNVAPALREALRSALSAAERSGRSVESHAVRLEREGQPSQVGMAVFPVDGRTGAASAYLVVFNEVQDSLRDVGTAGAAPGEVTRLEDELRQLESRLQDTVEDAETSTEELKAANEALQAMNGALRAANDRLRASEAQLQTANAALKVELEASAAAGDDANRQIASTDIATVFVDNLFRIERYTPRALDVFALMPVDVGRSLLDINHRLDYPMLSDDVAQAMNAPKTVERRVDTVDGRRRYLVRALACRRNGYEVSGAVITFIDVTALRDAEGRLRLAAETTRDYAIMTADDAGTITSWNVGGERVFGYGQLEMVGRSVDILFTPEDRALGMPAIERQTAREHGRAEDERWHLRKDGTRIFCSGVMTLLANGSGPGFAKIVRDVTDMKAQQAHRDAMLTQEQVARARSEAANKLKDELLAVMSHELKHPLNLILVNAELLTRLPAARGEAHIARAVDVIRKAVVGQGKIIDDLLDLSRSRTGKLTLQLVPSHLAAVVEPIVDAFAVDAADHGVALHFSAVDNLAPVLCDPVRVDQLVWNLLSNAVKFTPPGGKVDVTIDQDGAWARLTVADTGKGIAPEFLPLVFEMFTQEQRGVTRQKGGLGIGLALVSELVTAQGGRVEATSDGAGAGATFRVWLPLAGGVPVGPVDVVSERSGLANLRIIAVDDSRDALAGFVELLKLEGADAVGASNADDALALLDAQPFDVLISDLAMPDVDGFSLIAAVRKRPRLARLTAIALSGYGRDKDRREAIEAGFDAHVGKPASVKEIAAVVTRLRRTAG